MEKLSLLIIFFAMFLPLLSYSFNLSLELERTISMNDYSTSFSKLRAVDRARHANLFNATGILDLSMGGSVYAGIYTTKVKLGTPGKVLTLQVDTGSDEFWVTCTGCTPYCSQSSGISGSFDPASSSSAQLITCSETTRCNFSTFYGDESTSSGYFYEDLLYFNLYMDETNLKNSSAPLIFGCSTNQTGSLTFGGQQIDGIMGLGPGPYSVISQLLSMRVAPPVFTHCLRGDANGGGSLIFGEVDLPGIVYTPLVRSQPHYCVDLMRIQVNGRTLQVESSLFAKSTFIDSGSIAAYLPEKAYAALLAEIASTLPTSVTQKTIDEKLCYVIYSSPVNDILPVISLVFGGDAAMVLKPSEYLLSYGFDKSSGGTVWCLGIEKSWDQNTIIGDTLLRDKMVVYDLAKRRIGWIEYNCTLPVNVLIQYDMSSSSTREVAVWLVVVLHMSLVIVGFLLV